MAVGPHYTPNLALPYPDLDDPADVPADIQRLAERLDVLAGQGAPGGPGSPLIKAPVLDVGLLGQLRAGRQLALADFTSLGLNAPLGLWNLSDLTDASGNARALLNKGAVPFGVGINGQSASAAAFAGSTAQALYIADTGAADPFRIRTGSWGCWFRTAKRGVGQTLVSKFNLANQYAWTLYINSATNTLQADYSTAGTALAGPTGATDVADDRWHFGVVTYDATAIRIYTDGLPDAAIAVAAPLFGGSSPLNIGAAAADAATAAVGSHYGRVDEAFVSAEVLSEDQVRALYCAKIAHTLGVVPTRASLNVRRRRKGGALAPADFPSVPLRLHNFTGGSLADEGSGNVPLVVNIGTGVVVGVAGADGGGGGNGAYSFTGAHLGLSATDAGLPAALTPRSYGCWFKTTAATGTPVALGWGTTPTGHINLYVGNGALSDGNGSDVITGPFVADGQWHFAVCVEDNAAGDGVRRKLYCDGRLVGGSTVMNAIVLAGANRFRVGANPDGTSPWIGQADGAFVSAVALTMEQVAALYAKGSQALAPSPKDVGAHVEAMDATSVYVTFDTLHTQHQIDLGVAA